MSPYETDVESHRNSKLGLGSPCFRCRFRNSENATREQELLRVVREFLISSTRIEGDRMRGFERGHKLYSVTDGNTLEVHETQANANNPAT